MIILVVARRSPAVNAPYQAQSQNAAGIRACNLVPTADVGDIIPQVEESSSSEDSSGEEVNPSETASAQAEVTVPDFGNFNNSFNSLFNMKFEIDKFDGTGDFGIWRRKVKALLSQQKILRAIESPDKLPDSLTQVQKDDMLEMALGTIILNLSDNVLREVNDETTAFNIWNRLESLYLTKSLTNKIYLKKGYLVLRWTPVKV
ncbi:hypothetical protein Dsin_004949 [Dipteronia sinensis]|uniref:Uncharacterized protein n=1 Tax=Dipteronia sinensis TaxID=43782 RepID=A0AAE0AWV6_9ROSI|nr:hypothetical protein Dsin_004949 [Dipteronia sinensis]